MHTKTEEGAMCWWVSSPKSNQELIKDPHPSHDNNDSRYNFLFAKFNNSSNNANNPKVKIY